MNRFLFYVLIVFCFALKSTITFAQISWQNVDSAYQPLPPSVHVFFTEKRIDTSSFRAFYFIADLKEKNLKVTTDTTYKRRLTPSQFYERNNNPLLVVNGTFFSFETNENLNLVIKNGSIVSHAVHFTPLRGRDTLLYVKNLASAIGFTKKKHPDVAWVYTDSTTKKPVVFEKDPVVIKDSSRYISKYLFVPQLRHFPAMEKRKGIFIKGWQTAIGGGPVLLQNGEIKITNNEERKFSGKAINDKHPRTAMGYTADNKLIVLLIEGRNAAAGGANLVQTAQILKDLGCIEALNLDGGGSSCMLINGKLTINPAGNGVQRQVPAVFIIKNK